MRAEIVNFGSDNLKIYSVIGTATGGEEDELVQVGMLGEVGGQIEDNIYKFLPLSETSKHVAMIATPEVDADESQIEYNSLKGFKLQLGQVCDAVLLAPHKKIAIEKGGIKGSGAESMKVGQYVYAKQGERQLQYKATLPDTSTDNALLIGVIESIVPATSGLFIGSTGGKNIALNYDLVKIRFIEM